ncbi:NADH-FMN oxidoreductase RutF, flavin reductase (DIM6/NTAB) family [Flavobacteriaceae bacterium MAR_2010_188]|nr:NADH-FMN oxidoreductase RutF, flavin reductase (DIM6/NTAB) family [Flavobacteriaceae bacterium MAR_2010_188]
MAFFSYKDIEDLDFLYRINLINSCSGFKSANLIGTTSKNGNSNLAIFSSVTHLGSNPPLLGFFLRPTEVPRHTFDNINATGCYTINHIHQDIIEQAHHTSAKYDDEISEFEVTGLEEEYKDNFLAPFVKGCSVQLAMHYEDSYHIRQNDVMLIVGSIHGLYIKDEILQKDGFVDLAKANIVSINGLDGYIETGLIERLAYQRPKSQKA